MISEARKLAARMICFGFDGVEVNDHARRMIGKGCGACILFARNVRDPAQLSSMCGELKRLASPRKLLIMIDQEGGRVARLKPPHFTALPSARAVGSAPDAANAARVVAEVVASELRAVNVDMTLAPVVDVHTNPLNTVIGDRAFAADADAVAALGAAFIRALQAKGVAACAKHFPGHGDTVEDSHDDGLPTLTHDMDRLETVELKPFRAAIDAAVSSVLVAHVSVPVMEGIDPGKRFPAPVPASTSRACVRYLRRTLNFSGVVVTDDLEMGALSRGSGIDLGAAVVEAARSGVDMFLACHDERIQTEALEALACALMDGGLKRETVRLAGARLDVLDAAFVSAPRGVIEEIQRDVAGLVGTEANGRRIDEALGIGIGATEAV